jgi:hypothetical protein
MTGRVRAFIAVSEAPRDGAWLWRPHPGYPCACCLLLWRYGPLLEHRGLALMQPRGLQQVRAGRDPAQPSY